MDGDRIDLPGPDWERLARSQEASSEDYKAGLEELCRRYWRPIYAYIRSAGGSSPEDAEDTTQSFFLWLLQGGALKRFSPNRGSFRTFLKVLLKRFVRGERVSTRRLKRGGGKRILSLGRAQQDFENSLPDRRAATPEEVLDSKWVALLTEFAVNRVWARFLSEGREIQFRVFEAYDLCPRGETPTYTNLAGLLKLGEIQVRHYLSVVRQAVREEIHAELLRLTSDPLELEEEWALFKRCSCSEWLRA